jgi:hypothetical protein
MSSSVASSRSFSGEDAFTSSGMPHTALTGSDDASTTPLRSKILPRVAGSSSVRS